MGVRTNETAAWRKLKQYAAVFEPNLKKDFIVREVRTDHIYFDYSRQLLDGHALTLLLELAGETDLRGKIEAMFRGDKINTTENRAVLHTALRQQSDEPVMVDGKNVIPEIKAVLNQIRLFSEKVLSGEWRGVTGKRIKNIVSIGIGGSYLGPEYLAEACKAYAQEGMRLRFVANVDGADFAQKTADLDPAETMFIIVSKTFTTAETIKNAETAKRWMLDKLGNKPEVVRQHFVAVSTARELVEKFGIDPANMFGFWDWVGGRYSTTSAVGAVPISLFLGYDKFAEILKGADWMDRHFRTANFNQNIPVLAALIDIWNINLLGFRTRALLPYSQALGKLPAHTQQVEMESNGKMVDIEGRPVEFDTGEVVFGEPGTNGQHSFYQLIHQGTQIIPADFIGVIQPQYRIGEASWMTVTHHEELMTNFFAQPDALAFGKEDTNLAKHFPGNRPSSSYLLAKLTPFEAGLLLALTEHRTAVKGFIWGLNSFDQFGVELGKKLGVELRNRILKEHKTGLVDLQGLNPSTAALLQAYMLGQLPT